ncbi:hypothetical protein E2C01_016077 [Portunus trituberculatus]|uniref:Uncharacterized protein n=1 Tax=Portunus trituberculatus TaxID=210409 RepID=A0A5B7DN45_PORTR|nr:hypothetical protein [Portunus trituberculatus]
MTSNKLGGGAAKWEPGMQDGFLGTVPLSLSTITFCFTLFLVAKAGPAGHSHTHSIHTAPTCEGSCLGSGEASVLASTFLTVNIYR